MEHLQHGMVEVQPFNDCKHWYDAYLLDVILQNNAEPNPSTNQANATPMALVALAIKDQTQNMAINLNQMKLCEFDKIRFKPAKSDPVKFVENAIIELKIEHGDEHKLIAWKLVHIKKVKDTSAVVEYFDNDGQIIQSKSVNELDIISVNDTRAPNPFKAFSEADIFSSFVRAEFTVPNNLLQNTDSSWLSNIDFRDKFKKVENLINIYYNDKNKTLICLGFVQDQTEFEKNKFINQCNLLLEWHFRALKETYFITKYLPTANITKDSVLNVHVEQDLIGLAIGKQGVNIQKARKLDGIKSIELWEEKNTFIIRGTSIEICKQAAEMLNYRKETIEFIGQYRDFFANGLAFQEFSKKSGAFVEVRFSFNKAEHTDKNNNNDNKPTSVPMFHVSIVGTEESVSNFKMILYYQFNEYLEIREMTEKYRKLLAMLPPKKRQSDFRNFADVLKSKNL